MKQPNTILIGAHKAGTSSFFQWLSQHPEICAPEEMKDFHFFTIDKYYEKGERYLRKFYKNSNKEKITLHAGVQYIYFPLAAERIYQFNPASKLILIVRNPVKRAFSAHQYLYKLGIENLSFEEALEREKNQTFETREEQGNFEYLAHGFYYQQIETYLNHFAKEQILVILYEEMIKSKAQTIEKVFEFLNVETKFQPDFTHLNRTNSPKFRWINQLVFSENGVKNIFKKYIPILKLIPVEWKAKFGNRLREVNTQSMPNEKLDAKIIQKYMPLFESDIQQLSLFLNKDISGLWNPKSENLPVKNKA